MIQDRTNVIIEWKFISKIIFYLEKKDIKGKTRMRTSKVKLINLLFR